MYGINWTKFVEERLLSPIRKVTIRAWVHALLSPIKSLHTAFLVWKNTEERNLKITPQVRVLKHWLNELFDVDERRFDITNYVNVSPVLIWGQSYGNPVYLPVFLSSTDYGFKVTCPCELKGRNAEIVAFLEQFKLAGTTYKIVYKNPDGSICSEPGQSQTDDG